MCAESVSLVQAKELCSAALRNCSPSWSIDLYKGMWIFLTITSLHQYAHCTAVINLLSFLAIIMYFLSWFDVCDCRQHHDDYIRVVTQCSGLKSCSNIILRESTRIPCTHLGVVDSSYMEVDYTCIAGMISIITLNLDVMKILGKSYSQSEIGPWY